MSLKRKIELGAAYAAAGAAGVVRGFCTPTGHFSPPEADRLIDTALILSGAYLGNRMMTQGPLSVMRSREELPGTSFDGLMIFVDSGIELGKRVAGAGVGIAGAIIAERIGYFAGQGIGYIAAR